MTTEQLKNDLDYVAAVVRRRDRPAGVPAIFFLWAAVIAVGFALVDFARHAPGLFLWFWMIAGWGGGLFSMWLGVRDAKQRGIRDREEGRRWGLHWLTGGAAYLLIVLPLALGRVPPQQGGLGFLLVTGLLYALAGVHLERRLLWPGLMLLLAYGAMTVFMPPYAWTITGLLVGVALAWAGFSALKARKAGAAQ